MKNTKRNIGKDLRKKKFINNFKLCKKTKTIKSAGCSWIFKQTY
jgi:hypothetical protein